MNSDPLDQVFGELEELDKARRQQLADLIAPFARIHAESGTIGFLPTVTVSSKQRILIFLLSRLALSTKNPAFSPIVSPSEIEKELDMPGGTIRPKLAELVKARAVRNNEQKYSVRPSNLAYAQLILSDVLPRRDDP